MSGSGEPDYVAVHVAVNNPVTARARDGEIVVKAGPVTLALSDQLAGELVGVVEQARREAAQQRGER